MKKTVKVLFSLVLVCLFAVQFAGAMPASASADHVDSKWDNVQLDTSVYVYGDDNAAEKQDGDFGVKAGFSGKDASGKSTLGEFLNGDYTITPPDGYYVSELYICAASKADADIESVNLVGYATASKDSAKLTIARGSLATNDNGLNTSLFVTDDESSSYVAQIYLRAIDTENDHPTVTYNDGWLNGKVGGTENGIVDFDDEDNIYTHTVVNDYKAYGGVETYVGMTLKYANGATMAVEPDDVITLYTDATITAKYIVEASVTADNQSITYGDALPELTYTPVVPDGYTLVSTTATLGDYNAETGTKAIILSGAWIADSNGTALDADQFDLTVNNGTLTIAKRNVTIAAKPVTSEYTGSAINATEYEITSDPLAEGDTIKSVEYTGGPVNVGTGASTPCNAVIVDANGVDVTAYYNITYSAAEVTVSKYSGEVVITAKDATKPYDGSALTASTSDVTFTGLLGSDTVEVTAVSGEATVPGKDGTAKITDYVIKNAAGEKINDNYANIKLVDGKLTVTKRDITVTTGSATKAYDKTALTTKADDYSIISGSLVSGQNLTLTLSGTQTEPGSSKNTVKEGSLKISDEQGRDYTAYYNVTIKEGTLEVTGVKVIEISIKATSAKKVYDGTELTANSYDVVSGALESGDTLEVEYSGSITNAGTVANKIVKVTAKDANGKDVTAKYKISTQDGTLEITKAPLTVTAKSAEKVYDGKALTANTCEVKGSLAKGHKISATVTGSQTQIGSSKNKASNVKIVDANGNDVTSNYEITYVEGTLTVKAANAKPKTGDDANMGLWIGLMAVSAVIIAGGVVFFVKKNKKKNEQ